MLDMTFKWRTKEVEELVASGAIAKPLDGNHGAIHPKTLDFVPVGVPFIMASDLEAGRVNLDSCSFISEDQANTLRKGFARTGDVLISHKATIGRTAIVQESKYERIILTPQVTYYRILDSTQINAEYLKFYFDSPGFQHLLSVWAGAGSTRAYLGITAQMKLPIVCPPIDTQDAIAKVVRPLNDKIELNRRMNRTLEAMAQAIFKSWFVDFEPVKAKAAAKAAGASPEEIERAAMAAVAGKTEAELDQLPQAQKQSLAKTAALFPDGFQDSELGEIPEGWSIAGFNQLATLDTTSVKPFEAPNKVWEHYSIPSFDSSHLPAYEVGESIKSNKYAVKSGAILSSKLNPQFPRTWWPHLLDQESAICSTEFMQFVAVDVSEQAFIYGLITSASFQAGIAERVTGSTGSRQRAQPKQIATMAVVDPSVELRQEFVRLALPTYGKSNANLVESHTLAQLRDTLLPKLLSGELAIPEAN